MSIEDNKLKNILEAALMAVGKPMSMEQLMTLFGDDERPSATRVKAALSQLQVDCEGRGIELTEIASGYRYQARQDYAEWLSRLWEERAPKYSRAYLETLALIAYRQPVTRAEIEEVRGVSVSSNIVKTMLEREWIRVVGHRDVPGRPSLYATTRQFLDYFNMKSLDELPSLAEIRDLDDLSPELDLSEPGFDDSDNKSQDDKNKSAAADGEEQDKENDKDKVSAASEGSDEQSFAHEAEELALELADELADYSAAIDTDEFAAARDDAIADSQDDEHLDEFSEAFKNRDVEEFVETLIDHGNEKHPADIEDNQADIKNNDLIDAEPNGSVNEAKLTEENKSAT